MLRWNSAHFTLQKISCDCQAIASFFKCARAGVRKRGGRNLATADHKVSEVATLNGRKPDIFLCFYKGLESTFAQIVTQGRISAASMTSKILTEIFLNAGQEMPGIMRSQSFKSDVYFFISKVVTIVVGDSKRNSCKQVFETKQEMD